MEEGSCRAVSFDGTGYGDDGTIWGGELFVGSVAGGFRGRRLICRPATLPGGDAAAKYPAQAAAGFLAQIGGICRTLSVSSVSAFLIAIAVRSGVGSEECSSFRDDVGWTTVRRGGSAPRLYATNQILKGKPRSGWNTRVHRPVEGCLSFPVRGARLIFDRSCGR